MMESPFKSSHSYNQEEPDIIVLSSDEEDASATVNGIPTSTNVTANHPDVLNTETSQANITVKKIKVEEGSKEQPPNEGTSEKSERSDAPASNKQEATIEHFISLCRPQMKDEKEHGILDRLESLANVADSEFLRSKWFKNMLTSSADKVCLDSKNIFIYIKDIFDELKMHRKKIKNRHTNLQNGVNAEPENIVADTAETNHVPQDRNGVASSDDGKSKAYSEAGPSTSAPTHAVESDSVEYDPCQQRNINKLEQLLKKLHRKIRKIEMMEMSLDDLERSDSVYMMEEVYKRRIMRVWRKLCEARKQSEYTGRYSDKKFVFRGSRFPEVNRKIERFVNRYKQFPDFTDILKIVREASVEVPMLGIIPGQIEAIARDIFVGVGDELQRRRKMDVKETFHCIALNSACDLNDPADSDESLRRKLEEYDRDGNVKLQEIINKYATEQEVMNLKPDIVPDDAEEEEDDDEEEEEEILDNTSEEDAPVSDDDKKLNLAAGGSNADAGDAQDDVENFDVNDDSASSSGEESPSVLEDEGGDSTTPEVEETIIADVKSDTPSPVTSTSPGNVTIPCPSVPTPKERLSIMHLNDVECDVGGFSSTEVPISLHVSTSSVPVQCKRSLDDDAGGSDKKFRPPRPPSDNQTPPLQQVVMDDSGDVEIILLD